jgi:triacylglycerol esterase/lipase EstA (alpha/beta hydrolase family)
MNIEERGARIAKMVEEISLREKKKVHLVTHSFCGIDCRAAIELLGASKYVDTLTTVCTPH